LFQRGYMKELPTPATVRADFDRLASFADDGWNHNSHYHAWLLRHVPTPCRVALDLGCGAGVFTRLLAGRAERVYGIDLSPEMIRRARERSGGLANVVFHVADIGTLALPDNHFDCIVSIATLHHLPLVPTLAQLRDALRPGGVLLVLDLCAHAHWRDWLYHLAAVPVSLTLRLWHHQPLPSPRERAAWAAHGQHEVYATLSDLRQAAAATIPGAQLQRQLLWRYALAWTKPS
jgi:SAM-dependent methyltransferase